jgi:hypothetical protein
MMGHRARLDERALYRIQVQGLIGQQWNTYYQGFTISVGGEADGAVTMLAGVVQDQAALLGILNSLYQMGYALLSIECQSCPD